MDHNEGASSINEANGIAAAGDNKRRRSGSMALVGIGEDNVQPTHSPTHADTEMQASSQAQIQLVNAGDQHESVDEAAVEGESRPLSVVNGLDAFQKSIPPQSDTSDSTVATPVYTPSIDMDSCSTHASEVPESVANISHGGLNTSSDKHAIPDEKEPSRSTEQSEYRSIRLRNRRANKATVGSLMPKMSKKRHRVTPAQKRVLETVFFADPIPSRASRELLGLKLGMDSRTIQIWFQNRRAKYKKGGESSNGSAYPSPPLPPTRDADMFGQPSRVVMQAPNLTMNPDVSNFSANSVMGLGSTVNSGNTANTLDSQAPTNGSTLYDISRMSTAGAALPRQAQSANTSVFQTSYPPRPVETVPMSAPLPMGGSMNIGNAAMQPMQRPPQSQQQQQHILAPGVGGYFNYPHLINAGTSGLPSITSASSSAPTPAPTHSGTTAGQGTGLVMPMFASPTPPSSTSAIPMPMQMRFPMVVPGYINWNNNVLAKQQVQGQAVGTNSNGNGNGMTFPSHSHSHSQPSTVTSGGSSGQSTVGVSPLSLGSTPSVSPPLPYILHTTQPLTQSASRVSSSTASAAATATQTTQAAAATASVVMPSTQMVRMNSGVGSVGGVGQVNRSPAGFGVPQYQYVVQQQQGGSRPMNVMFVPCANPNPDVNPNTGTGGGQPVPQSQPHTHSQHTPMPMSMLSQAPVISIPQLQQQQPRFTPTLNGSTSAVHSHSSMLHSRSHNSDRSSSDMPTPTPPGPHTHYARAVGDIDILIDSSEVIGSYGDEPMSMPKHKQKKMSHSRSYLTPAEQEKERQRERERIKNSNMAQFELQLPQAHHHHHHTHNQHSTPPFGEGEGENTHSMHDSQSCTGTSVALEPSSQCQSESSFTLTSPLTPNISHVPMAMSDSHEHDHDLSTSRESIGLDIDLDLEDSGGRAHAHAMNAALGLVEMATGTGSGSTGAGGKYD